MKNLFGRVGKSSYHHDWISRDYEEISCKAIGCIYNIAEKCTVPTRCKIDDNGKCLGFEIKKILKIDGD